MHRPAPARVLPLLLASAAACGGVEVDEACALRDPSRCDIREAECVEHLHAVVACIRGAEHDLPKIDYLTVDEYREQLPTAEPTVDDLHLTAAYRLLRLLPADWEPPTGDPEITAPIVFYDWSKRSVTAVADGSDPGYEVSSMLYTLILADRDAEIGIDARLAEAATFDRKRALITLLSGEATFYTDLADLRVSDYAYYAPEFNYGAHVAYARDSLADPMLTWAQAIAAFQYYYGAEHMLARYLDDGHAGLDRAYDEHADSTATILVGPHNERTGALSEVDAPLPEPPPEFHYASQDSLGPVMYLIHLARTGSSIVDPGYEQSLARDWVGDRLIIAGDEDGERTAAIWQIAGPDASVAETIIVASDPDTEALFETAFGA
jgi:hypothetical protein